MYDEETAAIWVAIARAHAEAAELDLKKAELLYDARPDRYRLGLVQDARLGGSFSASAAYAAKKSFDVGNYKVAIDHAHRAFDYMVQARDAAALLATRDNDTGPHDQWEDE